MVFQLQVNSYENTIQKYDKYLEDNKLEKWTKSGKKELEYNSNDSILGNTKLFINKIRDNLQNPPYSVKGGLYGVQIAELVCQFAENGERKYYNQNIFNFN